MTHHRITLDECNFCVVPNDAGKFVGKVREFPTLRTRAQQSSIDALDDIITMTREKLRNLDAAIAGTGPAPRTTRGS